MDFLGNSLSQLTQSSGNLVSKNWTAAIDGIGAPMIDTEIGSFYLLYSAYAWVYGGAKGSIGWKILGNFTEANLTANDTFSGITGGTGGEATLQIRIENKRLTVTPIGYFINSWNNWKYDSRVIFYGIW